MASQSDIAARVSVSIDAGVAHVQLMRPDKRNALDPAMFEAIAKAGEDLAANREIRAVVLSGNGSSFCAGLDFASFQSMAGGNNSGVNAGAMKPGAITHLAQQICWVWQEVPVPVVAAIQGHALGGGMQLALG
ncbi:MAG: enoyl-CoA hydratase-related protein, partial [Actinomycetota bacterium]